MQLRSTATRLQRRKAIRIHDSISGQLQDVADFRTISKEKNESHLDLVKPLIGEDSKG